MKFFHLSDLHIGLKLMGRDLGEDQEYVFGQVISAAKREKPDAVVIAGDIYDKAVPPAEAVSLFDRFISGLSGAVPEAVIMMISGNHDSGPRVNLFRSVLEKQNIHMIGIPPRSPEEHIEKVILQDEYGEINFYLLPFVKPSMVRGAVGADEEPLSYDDALRRLIGREDINPEARNVLVSHQFYVPPGTDPDKMERMSSEVRTVGNIDEVGADILTRFDYAALGHIHKPMKAGGEYYRYCGTPLACSVDEAGQKKGIIMVEMREKGVIETTVLPLPALHEVRVVRGTPEEVLEHGCNDYVTVILTDTANGNFTDIRDRITNAFPNLLEIRRETDRRADYERLCRPHTVLEPFELCCSFLADLDAREKELLREVINEVREVK